MKVIILAAGRGSRLGRRTKDRPKCMCLLGGRTLLDRCLESLVAAGVLVSDIGIVTGYRSEMFAAAGMTYFHNPDWESTNMFYSLTMANAWLRREPCLVCYSDIVFSSNAVRTLIDSDAPLAITYYTDYWQLWEKRMKNPLEDLETFRLDADGKLTEIGQKPNTSEDIQGQFQEPLAKPVNKLDMTTLLQELLQRNYPVQAISTSDLWLECDSEHDINVYEQFFAVEL